MARGKFISYLRVSTDKQGATGLGIEAQRKAVEDYLNGGRWTLVAGVRRGRERQAPATGPSSWPRSRTPKAIGATLVIAKLDRLSPQRRGSSRT